MNDNDWQLVPREPDDHDLWLDAMNAYYAAVPPFQHGFSEWCAKMQAALRVLSAAAPQPPEPGRLGELGRERNEAVERAMIAEAKLTMITVVCAEVAAGLEKWEGDEYGAPPGLVRDLAQQLRAALSRAGKGK